MPEYILLCSTPHRSSAWHPTQADPPAQRGPATRSCCQRPPAQALQRWRPACAPGDAITPLRLRLCLALCEHLTLGDTSAEEELATAVLSRLVALTNGCRYPERTVARALQLLAEACALAGGGGAGQPGDAGGSASGPCRGSQQHHHQEQHQEQQGLGLEEALRRKLPQLHSALQKLLRHSCAIEALHLQLLADFIEEHCSASAAGAATVATGTTWVAGGSMSAGVGDSCGGPPARGSRSTEAQAPCGKRSRLGPASHGTAVTAGVPAAAPSAGASWDGGAPPPPDWARRVAQARRVLGWGLSFQDLLPALGSADVLQRYAALLLLSELFRGHFGVSAAAPAAFCSCCWLLGRLLQLLLAAPAGGRCACRGRGASAPCAGTCPA